MKFNTFNLLLVLTLSFFTVSQACSQETEQEGFAPIIDAPAPPIETSAAAASPQAGSGSSPESSTPLEGAVHQIEPSASTIPATIHRAPEHDAHPGEEYGPPNYLKVWKNPFGTQTPGSGSDQAESPVTLKPLTPIQRLALSRKMSSSKLYLPERILIGESSKFTVKGPPNWRVAIAMADRDEGAKPINNRKLRLGPDRKVVAIGKIPATGVLELFVATPIEGDLIGSYLFFEAAVWSKDDLSDTELADTVAPVLSKNPNANGVQIAALTEKKRGVRFVPDAAIPMSQNMDAGSLSSGKP